MVWSDMTLSQLLVFLSMLFTNTQPYDIPRFMDAIVATDGGNPLTWYTPRVDFFTPPGAPSIPWKGVTNCWPPVYSGVIVINPKHANSPGMPMTVLHELVHLQNNCYGSEYAAVMASYEAMAYMGRKQDIIYALYEGILTIQAEKLPAHIIDEYYSRPLWVMLYGDLTEYPNLSRILVDIGVREGEQK